MSLLPFVTFMLRFVSLLLNLFAFVKILSIISPFVQIFATLLLLFPLCYTLLLFALFAIPYMSFLLIPLNPFPPTLIISLPKKLRPPPLFEPSNRAQKLFLTKLQICAFKSYTLTVSSTPLYPRPSILSPCTPFFAKIFPFTPLYPPLP